MLLLVGWLVGARWNLTKRYRFSAHLTRRPIIAVLYGEVRKICVLNYRLVSNQEPSKTSDGRVWTTAVVAVLPLTENQLLKRSARSHREDKYSIDTLYLLWAHQNNQSLKDWMDKWMHKQTLCQPFRTRTQKNFNRHFQHHCSLLFNEIGKIAVKPYSCPVFFTFFQSHSFFFI